MGCGSSSRGAALVHQPDQMLPDVGYRRDGNMSGSVRGLGHSPRESSQNVYSNTYMDRMSIISEDSRENSMAWSVSTRGGLLSDETHRGSRESRLGEKGRSSWDSNRFSTSERMLIASIIEPRE